MAQHETYGKTLALGSKHPDYTQTETHAHNQLKQLTHKTAASNRLYRVWLFKLASKVKSYTY